MHKTKTKIVIVGAGFAGLRCALGLVRRLDVQSAEITLVDKRAYHMFTPNLYEVATAEEEFVSEQGLHESIAVPIQKVLENSNIHFYQGELLEVNQDQRRIKVGNKFLEYDYLVLTLGSESAFFGIPGAEEFSLPFKSFSDALRLRNAVEFLVNSHRHDLRKQNLRVLIAGGGYTGVELAGELAGLLDIVAWKNNYARDQIEILIVEAAHALVPGLDPRLSRDALVRLSDLKVRVQFGSTITKVEKNFLELSNGERLEYDVLAWTTGVQAVQPLFVRPVKIADKKKVAVNEYLQVVGEDRIFMAGDGCCVLDANGRPVPPTAQDAIQQGDYLSRALPVLMKNKLPKPFVPKTHGFIVSVGGKWGILKIDPWYSTGFFPYIARQFADWRYFASIVGPLKALHYLWKEITIFTRND